MAASQARAAAQAVPLAVDLDGTLIRSDLLFESLARLLRLRPWLLLWLPWWLLQGRSVLKARIAENAAPDVQALPYRNGFVDWLRGERAAGRRLVLATAADGRLARAVAGRLALFDEVLASAPGRNLKGDAKRAALVDRFGARGFDYAGDAAADLAVWGDARRAVVVGPQRLARAAAARGAEVERVFDAEAERGPRWRVWLKALRAHQWVKNVLVFLPLVAAHALADAAPLAGALIAFVALCLCASGTYLLNDLLDLDADRQHPRKCRRPLASGALPLLHGLAAAPVLMAAGLALATWHSPATGALVGLYAATTLLYSGWIKRKMLVDVFTLAALYTLRVLIGSVASGVPSSAWLLAFSVFTFLSLGAAKRGAELLQLERQGREATGGRDYFVWDRHAVAMLGLGAAFGAALVLALYLQSDAVRALYAQPSWLWLVVVAVLYWLARVWMVTLRGAMHDDPIVFAATDRLTWGVLTACAAFMAMARWAPAGVPGVAP